MEIKKKALLITPNFPPEVCGVGDYTHQLSTHLLIQDIQPFVLTGTANTVASSAEKSVFYLGRRFSFALLWQIIGICRANKIETIFWQYSPYTYSRMGVPVYLPIIMLALRLNRYRQVVYFHEITLRAWGYGFWQFCRAFIQQSIGRSMAAIAHKNITSIAFYRQFLWPFSVEIIPVGANILSNKNIPSTGAEPFIFSFANRVNNVAWKTMQQILEKYPVKWVLAGKCNMAQEGSIKKEIGNRGVQAKVNYLAQLETTELAALIQDCLIFFQPDTVNKQGHGGASTKNGTIIAAMAAARPIITAQGDMTDTSIFKHGDNVLLNTNGSVENYIHLIEHIMENNEISKQLSESASAAFQTYFNWNTIASSIAKNL